MKIIATLADMIDDEVSGAKEYICWACKTKEKDPTLSKTFYELSKVEMGHMDILHSQVTRLIEEERSKNNEPNESMMAMYELLHKKHIECAAQVKLMQDEYSRK